MSQVHRKGLLRFRQIHIPLTGSILSVEIKYIVDGNFEPHDDRHWDDDDHRLLCFDFTFYTHRKSTRSNSRMRIFSIPTFTFFIAGDQIHCITYGGRSRYCLRRCWGHSIHYGASFYYEPYHVPSWLWFSGHLPTRVGLGCFQCRGDRNTDSTIAEKKIMIWHLTGLFVSNIIYIGPRTLCRMVGRQQYHNKIYESLHWQRGDWHWMIIREFVVGALLGSS